MQKRKRKNYRVAGTTGSETYGIRVTLCLNQPTSQPAYYFWIEAASQFMSFLFFFFPYLSISELFSANCRYIKTDCLTDWHSNLRISSFFYKKRYRNYIIFFLAWGSYCALLLLLLLLRGGGGGAPSPSECIHLAWSKKTETTTSERTIVTKRKPKIFRNLFLPNQTMKFFYFPYLFLFVTF